MSDHAFVDESTRGGRYLICVVTCPAGDLQRARTGLRALLLPGQRRLHFATESNRRRREILSGVAQLGTRSVVYVAKHHDHRAARATILSKVAADLQVQGVRDLTLESREGQDHHDRAAIFRSLGRASSLYYRHARPTDEPLLWVPDSVAWAFGRGGEWLRRLDQLDLVADVVRVEVP